MPQKQSAPKTLAEHCARTTTERDVESEIRTMLELRGWRTHKIDVMRGVTVEYGGRGKRRFSEGAAGQPDLLAVRPPMGCDACHGMGMTGEDGWDCHRCDGSGELSSGVLYIECKRPRGGKLSRAQQAWHDVARRDGFIVIVARSWDELAKQAKDAGVEV